MRLQRSACCRCAATKWCPGLVSSQYLYVADSGNELANGLTFYFKNGEGGIQGSSQKCIHMKARARMRMHTHTHTFTHTYTVIHTQIYRFKWGELQPGCSADRPVTGPRQST
eukprot:612123-Pelagomonas_calceolata.AAC.1